MIGRAVEGEAAPAESLGLARHLFGCTACRIVLARERRLTAALDGMDDEVVDDAAFRDRVMRSLAGRRGPRGDSARASRVRRGLRLAAFVAALPALESVRHAPWPLGWEGFAFGLATPSVERLAECLIGLAGAAAAALAGAVPTSPGLPGLPAAGVPAGVALLAAAACAVASAGALLGASRVPLRRP